jgi:hypothetical protein
MENKEGAKGSIFDRKINRRKFLKFILLGTGLFSTSSGCFPEKEIKKFENFSLLPPENPSPSFLRGINLNAPFLWQDVDYPEKIANAFKNAEKIGARNIRVFINDLFEPELGRYNFDVLEKIKKLAQISPFPLQVDLFDAFSLSHFGKFNLFHSSSPSPSPYLTGDFFNDERLRNFFLRRVETIILFFGDIKNIVSWSVANELEPKGTKEEKREILTRWYEEIIKKIKEIDPERPILSGLSDPQLIDEEKLRKLGLTANTIHFYPDLFQTSQPPGKIPLVCQEIGFPSRIAEIKIPDSLYDIFFSNFLNNSFLNFAEINEEKGLLRLKTDSFWLWRLSYEGDLHQDGFEIIPQRIPRTLETISSLKRILESFYPL